MEHGAWQWTLGRQRIAWGSGRIWNPTDRFNPVQPTALEPEQKLGVDALQARWRYSGFGGVRAVFAPGRKAHGLSRKWALRWADTLAGQDVALLLARTGEEKIVGFDLTGNMHDAGYRFEGLRASGGAMGSYAQIVIGLDGTWRRDYLPNGLYLALEYFFNGARQGGQRVIDRVQALSRQQLGALAGYDLTPLWRLDLMVLADLEQTGLFFAPRLRWSFKENVDIELLGQWPGGRGAYAAFSPTTALQLKYYF
ncbi:MAG: hypothetical protein D6678_02765 [Zetaproteobacteria bacterium]|nr:MAG: hypothetical protein D6678_02765 [Zetaproteobacteria bacterium]